MVKNIVADKSYNFALKIIKLYLELNSSKLIDISILRQFLKSGTSIGANIKEAKETDYWLNLLKDTNIIDNKSATLLINECEELIKITTSIIKTSKNNTKKI